MTLEYRPMRAEETPSILALWCEIFGLPDPAYQAARLAADPAATHTYVAADQEGTIVAALHDRVILRRGVAGTPLLVGEIDSVVTRAEARRQGNATRLLLMALNGLRQAGCAWSLLVASGEDSRALYKRYGWRCYPEPWRRGTVSGPLHPDDSQYVVRPYDPREDPAGWDQIASVDFAFNRMRPLTVVRDAQYWREYAALRVGNWITTEGLVILAAQRVDAEARLCGFAMAEFYSPGFQVRDMAVLPEEPAATAALLAAVAAEAQRRGIPLDGRLYLPHEPEIDAAIEQLFGATLYEGQDEGHIMARPVAADFTNQQLDGIFAAPGAIFSAIDYA